jgi:ATP-dependent exoDNAse (exonuclease V) beta subunit
MTDTAESLDPLRLPLQGERLIEASAGTGKTFTIAALYLRLLLGLGGNAAFPRPLSVEELLVVTFTEAATAELRGRIRTNIHELRIACLRQSTDNPSTRAFWKRLPISSRQPSGCCSLNGRWTKRPSLPFTVFASAC